MCSRLLLSLMLVTFSASAKWLKVSQTDSFAIFADPSAVRANADLRRAWVILEMNQPQPNGERSRHVLFEWDCKNERERVLHLISHAGPMATGKVLLNGGNPMDWGNVSPNVPASIALFRFACPVSSRQR